MRVLDLLLKSVRDAAVFNPEVQVAPACILGRIVIVSERLSSQFFKPRCLNS